MFNEESNSTSFFSWANSSSFFRGPSSRCNPRLIQLRSLSGLRGFSLSFSSSKSRPTVDPYH